MIRVIRHERGPRTYIVGLRFHHGTAGLLALAAAAILRRRSLAIIGAAAFIHDARDIPFRDCDNH